MLLANLSQTAKESVTQVCKDLGAPEPATNLYVEEWLTWAMKVAMQRVTNRQQELAALEDKVTIMQGVWREENQALLAKIEQLVKNTEYLHDEVEKLKGKVEYLDKRDGEKIRTLECELGRRAAMTDAIGTVKVGGTD